MAKKLNPYRETALIRTVKTAQKLASIAWSIRSPPLLLGGEAADSAELGGRLPMREH
jgi:hypothetical protein